MRKPKLPPDFRNWLEHLFIAVVLLVFSAGAALLTELLARALAQGQP